MKKRSPIICEEIYDLILCRSVSDDTCYRISTIDPPLQIESKEQDILNLSPCTINEEYSMVKDVFDTDYSENSQKFLPLSFLNDKSEETTHESAPFSPTFAGKTGFNDSKIVKSPQYNTRIIKLVMVMMERMKLKLNKYGSLSKIDKMMISSIVFVKCNSILDYCHSDEVFVSKVNEYLREIKVKRTDDRLRFVFKRAIRHLFSKITAYRPTKNYRMDDFIGQFLKHYFPNNPEIEKSIMDTSFASKKKIQSLLALSPVFKRDFMEFINLDLISIHSKDLQASFQSMLAFISSNSSNNREYSVSAFSQRFKRLPWRLADIQNTIETINHYARCITSERIDI